MMLLPWSTPLDEHEARLLAVHLCEYACDGKRGRPESRTGVYGEVTEHRDFGPGYSSCADLDHWKWFRMGVRLPFVNRDEHLGWKKRVNISRLVECPFARDPKPKQNFGPGDTLIIWNEPDTSDAHVTVVIEDRGPIIETANYGSPGGSISQSRRVGDRIGVRLRKIQRWLPLGDVLRGAQRAGLLEPAQDPTLGEDGTVLWRPPT